LAAAALVGLFGLTSLVGGTIGYVKAGSMASILAGGISGILLILCAGGIFRMPTPSLIGAIVVSLALAGRFGPKALGLSEKAAGPVDYIMTVGGAAVIVLCAAALFLAPKPPSP
jgi:uncharacterized membrane protein (UPF0136 family)